MSSPIPIIQGLTLFILTSNPGDPQSAVQNKNQSYQKVLEPMLLLTLEEKVGFDAMQEQLLQIQDQKDWIHCRLPYVEEGFSVTPKTSHLRGVKRIFRKKCYSTTSNPTLQYLDKMKLLLKFFSNISKPKQFLEKREKGVELKDVRILKDQSYFNKISLPLKPLLKKKLIPKTRSKKKIEEDEFDIESKDINESEKKFKMLAYDEEIARKEQEDWEAKEEVKKFS
ncbi:hypothetical protein Tco_0638951 [Tanacetum coccineum]